MYRVVFLKLIGVFSCMCRMLSESLFVFIGAAGIQTILQNVDGLQAALAAPASAPAAAPSPTPVCCFSCRSIFCTVMHHCGSLEAVKAVTPPPPPPLTPTFHGSTVHTAQGWTPQPLEWTQDLLTSSCTCIWSNLGANFQFCCLIALGGAGCNG